MLSGRTLQEIEAGARALAARRSDPALPFGYMEAIMRTAIRHGALRRWEQDGALQIETVTKPTNDTTGKKPMLESYRLYHVKDGPTFDDRFAEQNGTSPSELLIANIALAMGCGGEHG